MKKPDGTFIVGIDLGTTYSLVATVEAGRPTIIPNALGEALTPSAVAFGPADELLVGAAARALAERAPGRAATSFKRDMGTDRRHELAGQAMTSVELSALLLGALKADAEAALGGPVSEAVITVPAYYGDAQRTATREAAELAGLECRRLVNEPTAAALAHGFAHRDVVETVAVLDLGGGTFDVTLLEITEGIIEIQSTAGDVRLGGDDFTRVIADILAGHAARVGVDVDPATVREAAERAKHGLSRSEAVSTSISDSDGQSALQVELTRAEVDAAWASLQARLTLPIERAMRDAGWDDGDVDRVLLVGGATRMPLVARLAHERFGKPPQLVARPDETVALGAAVQAALMISHESVEDVVSTDIAPFTLGIQTTREIRGRFVADVYAPILERGTVLPASRAKVFSTLHPDQTEILVQVYQGEHPAAAQNDLLGEVSVKRLPAGQINDVEIRFTYDLNGLLEIEATALVDQRKTNAIIDRTRGQLSKEERARILARFEGLKVHPRDLLPNRVALERAESAYARALGVEREMISEVLAAFRAALETGDDIDQLRDALNSTVREIDG